MDTILRSRRFAVRCALDAASPPDVCSALKSQSSHIFEYMTKFVVYSGVFTRLTYVRYPKLHYVRKSYLLTKFH